MLDTPGDHVTRDYREGAATLADLTFTAIDTSGTIQETCASFLAIAVHAHISQTSAAGLEPFMPNESIQARATSLTANVLDRCTIALLMYDGRYAPSLASMHLKGWPDTLKLLEIAIQLMSCL